MTITTEVWRYKADVDELVPQGIDLDTVTKKTNGVDKESDENCPVGRPPSDASKNVEDLLRENELLKIQKSRMEGELRKLQEDYDIKHNECEEVRELLEDRVC